MSSYAPYIKKNLPYHISNKVDIGGKGINEIVNSSLWWYKTAGHDAVYQRSWLRGIMYSGVAKIGKVIPWRTNGAIITTRFAGPVVSHVWSSWVEAIGVHGACIHHHVID